MTDPAPDAKEPRTARVIALARARDARALVSDRVPRCTKCASTFVAREPAFIHCRYCGNMMRLPDGALLEQDTYELRSGLRSVDAIGTGLYG